MPSLKWNPWENLPQTAPFVLAEDAPEIARFNRIAKAPARIDLSLLPEPYIGRFDAPVVLLNLNPGWTEQSGTWHGNPTLLKLLRANLSQEPSQHPFYFLNPLQ